MLLADDIVVCCTTKEDLERKVEYWGCMLEDRGLNIRRDKTEYLRLCDESVSSICREMV